MAVDLWWAERGSGTPLVLLHPGGTDARALEPLLAALGDGYRLITPEQRAHGHTRDAGELTFDAMAADTVAFLERLGVGPVHLFGYSDGAIVALYVTLARPDLVADLVKTPELRPSDGNRPTGHPETASPFWLSCAPITSSPTISSSNIVTATEQHRNPDLPATACQRIRSRRPPIARYRRV